MTPVTSAWCKNKFSCFSRPVSFGAGRVPCRIVRGDFCALPWNRSAHSELDGRGIRINCHFTAKRVDFTDLPFATPPIAGLHVLGDVVVVQVTSNVDAPIFAP